MTRIKSVEGVDKDVITIGGNRKEMRLAWLDVAKGLGIIAVVLSHSQCHSLIWIVSACFVPIFFVCSGYTMKEKPCVTYMQFVRKKSKRLLLPYMFCMLLIVAFNYIVGLALHSPFDWFRSTVGVIYSRACLYPSGIPLQVEMLPMFTQPMWFLTALLLSLIVAYPIIKICKSWKRMFMLTSILLISTYLFSFIPLLLPWSLDTLPVFVLMILFGKTVRENNLLKKPNYIFIILFVIYIFSIVINGMPNFSVREYGKNFLLTTISAFSGSLLLMKLSCSIVEVNWLQKILSALGRHSLYIMCLHLPILAVLAKMISYLPVYGILQYTLYLCSVLLTIIVSFLLSTLIESKIPMLNNK